jgi:cell division protein FtsI/penicillin-binding protein 2
MAAMGVGVPIAITAAVVSLARHSLHADPLRGDAASIAKRAAGAAAAASAPPPTTLEGLNLAKMTVTEDGATAPVGGARTAHLTVEPALQRETEEVMRLHRLPEAAIVLMDVASGKILVYASRLEKGPERDLCVEATAPAASVFKIVTATALVERAGLSPDRRECYSGGEQRITEKDLEPNPKRDRWCSTLAGALGRSLNTVFAREALHHLKPPVLEDTARALGFGASLPFDAPVQPGGLTIPEDPLGFARTAAGFWNTTLSPLHAAWISATVARGGEPVRPFVVANVVENGHDKPIWTAPAGLTQRRAMKPDTAQAVTTMMEETVSGGTSYKAFHDGKGRAFLGSISVAGKTGTLTDGALQRYYSWFTGFAPSRAFAMPEGAVDDDGKPLPPPPKVAIGVLIVNHPTWNIKANTLAREVLRAYFASRKVPGVTPPIEIRRSAHSTHSTHSTHAPRSTRSPKPHSRSTTPGTKHALHRGS